MNSIRMTEKFAEDLGAWIEQRMGGGDTYEEAKAYAQERSVAGPAVWDLLDEKYGKPPAQTNADRQRAYRARKAADSKTEVRGVFAKPEHHAKIKQFAAGLAVNP